MFTEIQLQKKWKSIRDCFQKYVQNPNKTRRPYIYFKHLQFLLKSDSPVVTPANEVVSSESDDQANQSKKWRFKRKLKLPKADETSDEDNDNGNFDNNDESRDYSNEGVDYEFPVKVAKVSKPSDEFAFANVDAQLKNENDDPDRLFLLSLLPHLKAVPEESRLNVKMDLMQVLRNASYSVSRDQKIF